MALTDSLVSYWKLDESSDGSAPVTRLDSVGSNHLTDNNTTPSATGKIGNAASFTQANNEFLSITDAAQSGLDVGTGDLALSFWINTSNSGLGSIASKDTAWRIVHAGTQLSVMFGGFVIGKNIPGVLTLGAWNHVVVNFDRSGNVEAFVNGTSVGTASMAVVSGQDWSNASDFIIGDTDILATFTGLIDCFGIWVGRILSTDEIATLYGGGTPPAYPWTPANPVKVLFINGSGTIKVLLTQAE